MEQKINRITNDQYPSLSRNRNKAMLAEVDSHGSLPICLGIKDVVCDEMMFYQYLPIKFPNFFPLKYEERLDCFSNLIYASCNDFINSFGMLDYQDSYIYLTAKHLYQAPNTSFNRFGYHTDGFMTDDINYIWCDKFPTIFNTSNFNLTLDDKISMVEMESQALQCNEFTFPEKSLLRLNQFNVHKVAPIFEGTMRTFVKISFSKDKYDLSGNSHNYKLEYDWKMKNRSDCRNIPQSLS